MPIPAISDLAQPVARLAHNQEVGSSSLSVALFCFCSFCFRVLPVRWPFPQDDVLQAVLRPHRRDCSALRRSRATRRSRIQRDLVQTSTCNPRFTMLLPSPAPRGAGCFWSESGVLPHAQLHDSVGAVFVVRFPPPHLSHSRTTRQSNEAAHKASRSSTERCRLAACARPNHRLAAAWPPPARACRLRRLGACPTRVLASVAMSDATEPHAPTNMR